MQRAQNKSSAKAALFVMLFSFTNTAIAADWSYFTGAKGQRQDTNMWCWAATSRLIIRHNKKRTPVQCKLASRWIAKKDYGDYCCTGGTNEWGRNIPSASRRAACIKGFNPTVILQHYGAMEKYAAHRNSTAGKTGIEKQLRQDTPPIVHIEWSSTSSHALSIVSGKFANGTTRYELYNPTGGREWIKRSDLKAYKSVGNWIGTWHSKK